jgi:hypothetical protein
VKAAKGGRSDVRAQDFRAPRRPEVIAERQRLREQRVNVQCEGCGETVHSASAKDFRDSVALQTTLAKQGMRKHVAETGCTGTASAAEAFDIDKAAGPELDAIGELLGIDRDAARKLALGAVDQVRSEVLGLPAPDFSSAPPPWTPADTAASLARTEAAHEGPLFPEGEVAAADMTVKLAGFTLKPPHASGERITVEQQLAEDYPADEIKAYAELRPQEPTGGKS